MTFLTKFSKNTPECPVWKVVLVYSSKGGAF